MVSSKHLMLFCSCPPATVFLEFWKRRRAVLAYDWDLIDWEEEEVKFFMWSFHFGNVSTCSLSATFKIK